MKDKIILIGKKWFDSCVKIGVIERLFVAISAVAVAIYFICKWIFKILCVFVAVMCVFPIILIFELISLPIQFIIWIIFGKFYSFKIMQWFMRSWVIDSMFYKT